MTTPPSFLVSERFEQAAKLAIELRYRNQVRKRNPGEPGPPYIGHVFGVGGLVIEDGGSEDEGSQAFSAMQSRINLG